MICYSYNKAINQSSSLSLSKSPPSSSSLSSSSSLDTNLLPTPEKLGKKLQKNNIQNAVTREHIKVDSGNDKENGISNASNSTKTDENKNRNNEVKSVVIIDDSMIKHLNG